MPDFVQRGPIDMLFVTEPYAPGVVGVLLCEMEFAGKVNPVWQPGKVAKPLEFEEIGDDCFSIKPTFRLSRMRLQQLADELARIGVYPSKLPDATEAQTKAHLDDLRHSRDFVETRLCQTLDIIAGVPQMSRSKP